MFLLQLGQDFGEGHRRAGLRLIETRLQSLDRSGELGVVRYADKIAKFIHRHHDILTVLSGESDRSAEGAKDFRFQVRR